MIISAIDLPTQQIQNAAQDGELLTFLNHVSLISSLMLRAPSGMQFDETTMNLVLEIVQLCPCFMYGFSLLDDEIAANLLDNGLQVAYFHYSEKDKDLLVRLLKSFPRARVGIFVSHEVVSVNIMNEIVNEFSEFAGQFLFKCPANDGSVLKAAKDLICSNGFSIQICFELPTGTSELTVINFGTFTEGIQVTLPVRIRDFKSSEMRNPYSVKGPYDDPDIVSLFLGCMRSDRPDKLYTTVVCDEHGVCLGLVYSNDESVRVAVLERRGVYWSRSRAQLWRKGDSSGMHQDLLCVKVDCDFDALRFTVIQRGDPPAFCHLMTRTCWGHVSGVKKLESILLDRRRGASKGSYTRRLFEDGALLKQRMAEAAEQAAGARGDDAADKAADLLYLSLVKCVGEGVGLRELERALDRRSLKIARRPGCVRDWLADDLKKSEEKEDDGRHGNHNHHGCEHDSK